MFGTDGLTDGKKFQIRTDLVAFLSARHYIEEMCKTHSLITL